MGILSTVTLATAQVITAIPDPDAVQPPGTQGLTDILSWAKWVALAICLLGIFTAGALMAINQRRGEGGEHTGRIGMALGGVVVISAAATLIGFLAT
ncbi:hypothetical protein [Cellulomonas cellasea]|jgi:hypothetical protein|uniref:Conjugal transfer protein TrbC n=1 Tax=Cellulomonas cellasea TaxID=43670 RepID=A0A7W4YDW7_9CELL|nr:hypothetical protein [Cellulomonas cellasea]MBB2925584.1 hypothetical protein [Cellulomonas cellasea]